MGTKWFKLVCSSKELQLTGTLNGGQSFRWKKLDSNEWIGVFDSKCWILKQQDDYISYQVHEKETQSVNPPTEETYNILLKEYFQLNLNLQECYTKWSECDPNFKSAAEKFYGIRILKQDPVENIFSFICSSNNNIARITSMVEKLATFYGEKICDLNNTTYYSFPSISALNVEGVEAKLRESGFGYRAKYIAKSAILIKENGGESWLKDLKGMEYHEAKQKLSTLTGVGAKVADCICLMSLGHLQAIPVDTHVYQIAARHYIPKLAMKKSLTDNIYNEIGDHFRKLYGPLAGWAHTVLFCADLKKFQTDTQPRKKLKTK